MGMSKFKNLHSLLTWVRGWFDKIKLLLHKSSLINWIDPIRCRRRKIGWLIAMDDIQKTKQISVSGFFLIFCALERRQKIIQSDRSIEDNFDRRSCKISWAVLVRKKIVFWKTKRTVLVKRDAFLCVWRVQRLAQLCI